MPGRYGDGQGLYLQVGKTGARSWLLRYAVRGKERWMGLGPLHTFTLEEARERARKARQQLQDGVDPLESKQATRTAQALAAARRSPLNKRPRNTSNSTHRNDPAPSITSFYARPGAMHSGFEQFKAFDQDAIDQSEPRSSRFPSPTPVETLDIAKTKSDAAAGRQQLAQN